MSDHPAEPLLLQYFDGTLPEAEDRAVAAHVDGCACCRELLEQLAAFEGFVVRHLPGDALADADMFEVAERTLVQRDAAAARRRWWGMFGATAVALVAAGIALFVWFDPASPRARFRLVRHTTAEAMRQMATVRFHLESNLAEPVFVNVWVRFVDGTVAVLLPDDGPEVPLRGDVRLPANALLDWEYAAPKVPSELLVVTSKVALDDAVRRRLGEAWRQGPVGVVPSEAEAAGDAQVLKVPDSPQ